MPVYVITKHDAELYDMPVFYAGEGGKEEAIAVFTNRNLASQFVGNAGWNGEHVTAELTAIDLLRLMIEAHEEGTQYLAVNPVRREHFEVENQTVIIIEQQMANFAEKLTEAILEQALAVEGAVKSKR